MYGSTLAQDLANIYESSNYKRQRTSFHEDYRFRLQEFEFILRRFY